MISRDKGTPEPRNIGSGPFHPDHGPGSFDPGQGMMPPGPDHNPPFIPKMQALFDWVHGHAQADVTRVQRIWRECREHYSALGPWLFGDFSIADAMYAPVVLRFNSYGAEVDATSREYMHHVLQDTHMRSWISASRG